MLVNTLSSNFKTFTIFLLLYLLLISRNCKASYSAEFALVVIAKYTKMWS